MLHLDESPKHKSTRLTVVVSNPQEQQQQVPRPPRDMSITRTRAAKAMSIVFNNLKLSTSNEAAAQREGQSIRNHKKLPSEERQQASNVFKLPGREHHSGRLNDSLLAKMCSTRPPNSTLSFSSKSHECDIRYFGDFVPVNDLHQLMQLSAVEQELRMCAQPRRHLSSLWRKAFTSSIQEYPETFQSDARKICGQKPPHTNTTPGDGDSGCQYTRILAVLALIEKPHKIRSFLDLFSDNDLPINFSRDNSDELPPLFKQWRTRTIRKFANAQWSVLSPQFYCNTKDEIPHHKFENGTIPPFTSWKSKNNNGLSRVAMVSIHPHHHNFTDDNEVCAYYGHLWLEPFGLPIPQPT